MFLILCLAVVALIAYFFFQGKQEDTWLRCGVKSPKLSRFYFITPFFKQRMSDLLNQYGDTVGVYSGSAARLITTNFDLMRHVLVKDFNNFVDRVSGIQTKSPFGKSMFFAKGLDWKRQRLIANPTFTSGKLRNISRSVQESAQALVSHLEKCASSGQLVPVKDDCGKFSSEVIAKTAFGLDAKFIGQEDCEFTKYAGTLLPQRTGLAYIFNQLMFRFPSLRKFLVHTLNVQWLDSVNSEADRYFKAILKNAMQERKEEAKTGEATRPDFLQYLMNANAEAAKGVIKPTDFHWQDDHVKTLTDDEIYGQSVLIIFAGYETTATALQMALYALAEHQDIQERLYKEVKELVPQENPSHDEVSNVPYLDQVINETLRMWPPVPLINRRAKETRTYNGVTIPAGTEVIIPFWHIFSDPNLFPDPEKFDPDRFSPEQREKRDPMAFVNFGHGPRLCLGKRLAYLELRHALVRVVKRLRVVLNDQTEPKTGQQVELQPFSLIVPTKPIKLAFELR